MQASEFTFALAAVVATHFAFEVGLHAALPPQFSVPHVRVYAQGFETWQPNARFDYWNLPGVVPAFAPVEINDDGLRDRPVAKPKPAGQRRVVVVGDSNTAAMQLPREQIFTTRLGELLRGRAKDDAGDVRVVNAGMKGSGLAEHLLWLRHRGFALQPDLVVVQLAADDPDDDLAHGGFTVEGGRLVEAPRLLQPAWWRGPALALRDAVCNRSLVYYRVWTQVRSALTAPPRVEEDVPWWMRAHRKSLSAPAPSSMPGSLLDLPPKPLPSATAAGKATPGAKTAPDAGVTLSAALLRAMVEESARHGIPVLVLPLPHPLYLDQGYPRMKELVARGAVAPARVVRVDEALRSSYHAGRNPYLVRDGHLSRIGHRLVAEALAPAVEAALSGRDGTERGPSDQ